MRGNQVLESVKVSVRLDLDFYSGRDGISKEIKRLYRHDDVLAFEE